MVNVKEIMDEVIFRNGIEASRKSYRIDVGYCDDCGKEITDYRSYEEYDNKCHICKKDLCDEHRLKYPTEKAPADSNWNKKRWICERCSKQFAKELKEVENYLITKNGIEQALYDFKHSYGDSWEHPDVKLNMAGADIRKKQAKHNSAKARRMQMKVKSA